MTRDDPVRLQNVKDFAVEIRNASNKTVGTGFVVSADGKIVTCAHVLLAAGLNPRASGEAPSFWVHLARKILDGKPAPVQLLEPEVAVVLPGSKGKTCRARVVGHFPDFDDDVVVLQVRAEDLPPLEPTQIGNEASPQTAE